MRYATTMLHLPGIRAGRAGDDERMQNLIEGLSERGEGDDALDEIIREGLAARGLTIESWAAQWEGKYQEALAQHERARRARRLKIAAAATVGISAVAAGGALAVHATRGMKGGVDVQQSIDAAPPASPPSAGRPAQRRR